MTTDTITLPGLDCGMCGYRLCSELEARLITDPEMARRCIHLSNNVFAGGENDFSPRQDAVDESRIVTGSSCRTADQCGAGCSAAVAPLRDTEATWKDSLGRDFDFYLEHFPRDPGPREIILPHNPMITREMDLQVGDVIIGRPLGMSCGCPITHCGIVVEVDHRTGVMTWCVTGPLRPRETGFKDIGYYIAEGYDGLVAKSRCEIKIGMRYFFQPRMCMLQWRHSGLVNFINRTPDGMQVRLEGLWIG